MLCLIDLVEVHVVCELFSPPLEVCRELIVIFGGAAEGEFDDCSPFIIVSFCSSFSSSSLSASTWVLGGGLSSSWLGG